MIKQPVSCSVMLALLVLLHLATAAQVAVPSWIKAEAFVRACDDGDIETVKRYLSEGVSPNTRDRFGQPALFRVLRDGPRKKYDTQAEIVKLLLERGADASVTNEHGSTALFLLPSGGGSNGQIRQMLVRAGIDPRYRDKWGLTAEEKAGISTVDRREDPDVIWRFLSEGNLVIRSAMPNPRRHSNSATFAMGVAYYGESYQQPLEFRSDPAVDRNGETYLFYLESRRRFNSLELTEIDKGVANMANRSGETALIRAAQFGNEFLAGRLLGAGADPDRKDASGRTALIYATAYDHYQATLVLLTRADPNMAGPDSVPPLIAAIKGNNQRSLAAFVNAGLMPAQINKDRKSAAAADAGLAAAFRRIDPNVRDGEGMTPLMHAASTGDRSVVEAVLKLRPARDLIDRKGRTALSIARASGHKEIASLLTSR